MSKLMRRWANEEAPEGVEAIIGGNEGSAAIYPQIKQLADMLPTTQLLGVS